MRRKFKVIRDVTNEECHWIDETVPQGKLVYEYTDHTYGCISHTGVAVSDVPGEIPFYEMPINSLEIVND